MEICKCQKCGASTACRKRLAAELGRKGRAVNSAAQKKAAAENGKKGGRPKKYTISESDARADINTIYRDTLAWDKGVRSYNRGVPGCITAGTYVQSPRSDKFAFVDYGTDETYKIKSPTPVQLYKTTESLKHSGNSLSGAAQEVILASGSASTINELLNTIGYLALAVNNWQKVAPELNELKADNEKALQANLNPGA